jgi:hypothetical protein
MFFRERDQHYMFFTELNVNQPLSRLDGVARELSEQQEALRQEILPVASTVTLHKSIRLVDQMISLLQ